MKVLVTGANGFIGQALVRRLLSDNTGLPSAVTRLIAMDQSFNDSASDARVKECAGDIADPDILRGAIAEGVDVAFHLASVPGGLAESNYELGRRVNLDATIELFEQLGKQPRKHGTPPVVVFASSVAVYGSALPAVVDAHTASKPNLSYGVHKMIGECVLRDLTRRGELDGRALRLPGVVARPRMPSGLMSAYMSEIMHALAAGEAFICPVSAQATSWWMSAQCCVDNLVHAARLPASALDTERTWALPVLRFTMAELVEALAKRFGTDRRALVRYAPQDRLEAAFGRYPPLLTPEAEALGFCNDGSISALIDNALADVR